MCETTSRGRRTVKIPTIQRFRAVRAPSHPRTLRGRTWNRHRPSSSRVKAERGFINNSLCVSSHCGDFLQTHSCLYIYLGCGKDSSIFFLFKTKTNNIQYITTCVLCLYRVEEPDQYISFPILAFHRVQPADGVIRNLCGKKTLQIQFTIIDFPVKFNVSVHLCHFSNKVYCLAVKHILFQVCW